MMAYLGPLESEVHLMEWSGKWWSHYPLFLVRDCFESVPAWFDDSVVLSSNYKKVIGFNPDDG